MSLLYLLRVKVNDPNCFVSPVGQRSNGLMASLCASHQLSETVEDLFFILHRSFLECCHMMCKFD